MAVINAYVDADVVAGKLGGAIGVRGNKAVHLIQSFTIASTDQAGSIYRVFKGVSPDMIIRRIEILNDALTGATSVSLGLYGVLDYDNVGAVVSAACFMSAKDISAGNPITGSPFNGLSAVTIANREKRVYELAGHTQTTKLPAYDIGMLFTAMTTGANGNVCVMIDAIQG